MRDLHARGVPVGCVARDPSRVSFDPAITVHRADMLDPSSLSVIGDGYPTAYYLVHSPGRLSVGDVNEALRCRVRLHGHAGQWFQAPTRTLLTLVVVVAKTTISAKMRACPRTPFGLPLWTTTTCPWSEAPDARLRRATQSCGRRQRRRPQVVQLRRLVGHAGAPAFRAKGG